MIVQWIDKEHEYALVFEVSQLSKHLKLIDFVIYQCIVLIVQMCSFNKKK